jgi:hypothetical protein
MTRAATAKVPAPRPAHRRRNDGQAPRGCFDDPHLLDALQEMEALGLRVAPTAHAGAIPFDVLAGRARLRWFLLPRRPHAASVAALAMIQPLRPVARAFKLAMVGAARVGVPRVWRQGTLHVSGAIRCADVFGPDTTQAAFLTGTAGPHRKLTVQLMTARGDIRGYAKVSRTPAGQALIANEGLVLAQLRALGLHAATVPRVLLRETRNGAAVLATDSARTPHDACSVHLRPAHLAFLEELAARTASPRVPDGGKLLRGLRAQVTQLAPALPYAWRPRLERALQELAFMPSLIAPRGLAHGDFTPGNTFRHRDRLCVFDWEYAGYAYPADYDLIRFLLAARDLRRADAVERCFAIAARLSRDFNRPPAAAHARLTAFLCTRNLMLAGRRANRVAPLPGWEGERTAARMLDALLAGPGRLS